MRIWPVNCILKILSEYNNEMKRVWGKWFLLMRDNSSSHINNKTTEFIKNIKIKEYKDWSLFHKFYSPSSEGGGSIFERKNLKINPCPKYKGNLA